MKRKSLVIAVILIAGLALVLVALQIRGASARNITLKEILFPQNIATPTYSAPSTTDAVQTGPTATVFPEGMPNPPTAEINLVYASQEQIAINEAIIESARSLIEKAEKEYFTPGWLHIAGMTEAFFSVSDTLPDGSPVPTEWRDDSWKLWDENGYVVQAVNFQDTGSPKTSQISIFKDGIWTNLTLGIGSKEKETHRPRLDSGFLDNASRYKDTIILETSEDFLGLEPVTVFTLTERNINPVEILKSGYFTMGTLRKYYYSTQSGLLLKVEHYHIMPDGQYQLANRITTIVIEKVEEPPAEVLKYLE